MQKINRLYQFKQYAAAILSALIIFGFLSIYLFFRRGYYDLYIANKAFAGAGTILLGLVLLIGPLSRIFAGFARYLQYRKELGIVAFFLILAHSLVSLFFLPTRFPLSGFLTGLNWPFIYGLSAIILLTLVLLISNNWAMTLMGAKRWWWWQNWGARVGFLLIFLHVFVMKFKSWISWYKEGGSADLRRPDWPGAGLLVGWIILFVILMRLSEVVKPQSRRKIYFALVIALPLIYLVTFWWGRQ